MSTHDQLLAEVTAAEEALDQVAAQWLDARAKGPVSPAIELRVREAEQEARRTNRRLQRAERQRVKRQRFPESHHHKIALDHEAA